MVRTQEEIEEAIIMAIKKGSRSLRDISISANPGTATHKMMKKYLYNLIDKGIIEEAEPSIFDHGHVKTIYKLMETEGVCEVI